MKKILVVALLAIFAAGPVLADGAHRSEPGSKDSCHHHNCKLKDCAIVKGIVWTFKLPFRLVTSTGYGVYDLITEQEFDGFADGYRLIK